MYSQLICIQVYRFHLSCSFQCIWLLGRLRQAKAGALGKFVRLDAQRIVLASKIHKMYLTTLSILYISEMFSLQLKLQKYFICYRFCGATPLRRRSEDNTTFKVKILHENLFQYVLKRKFINSKTHYKLLVSSLCRKNKVF